MKLFNDFEAVKFPEENMIFVTNRGSLYYIYDAQYKFWRKHNNAGNDSITVSNYDDVSKEELQDAMQGIFPEKETDFIWESYFEIILKIRQRLVCLCLLLKFYSLTKEACGMQASFVRKEIKGKFFQRSLINFS